MEADRRAPTIAKEALSPSNAQVTFTPHADTSGEVAAYLPLGQSIRRPCDKHVVFGRGVGCDVHINAAEASRQHAYLGPLPLWMQPRNAQPANASTLTSVDLSSVYSAFALVNRSRSNIRIDDQVIKPGDFHLLPDECRLHFGPVSFDVEVRPGSGSEYEFVMRTL